MLVGVDILDWACYIDISIHGAEAHITTERVRPMSAFKCLNQIARTAAASLLSEEDRLDHDRECGRDPNDPLKGYWVPIEEIPADMAWGSWLADSDEFLDEEARR